MAKATSKKKKSAGKKSPAKKKPVAKAKVKAKVKENRARVVPARTVTESLDVHLAMHHRVHGVNYAIAIVIQSSVRSSSNFQHATSR